MLGNRIKELRLQKGITQEQLAQHLNVAKSTIGMWENEKREPDVSTLIKLSNYFHCSIDQLVNDKIRLKSKFHESQPEHLCPRGHEMTEIFLSNSAKAALFNASYEAEENLLTAVHGAAGVGSVETREVLYRRGIYRALYDLICRFDLEADYLDWVSEPTIEEEQE